MIEKCGNCVFGIRDAAANYLLACQRHAPIVFAGVVGLTSRDGQLKELVGAKTVWPTVHEDSFCGDWELEDAS